MTRRQCFDMLQVAGLGWREALEFFHHHLAHLKDDERAEVLEALLDAQGD